MSTNKFCLFFVFQIEPIIYGKQSNSAIEWSFFSTMDSLTTIGIVLSYIRCARCCRYMCWQTFFYLETRKTCEIYVIVLQGLEAMIQSGCKIVFILPPGIQEYLKQNSGNQTLCRTAERAIKVNKLDQLFETSSMPENTQF